jgi:hypothetical protein
MKKLLFLFTLSLLLVSMAWGQVYLINEGFESTTFPPTGWTNSTNGAIRTTNNPRTGSACMGFNGVNDAIYTPQLSNPNQLSFWYRRSSKTTAWTLNVQVSTDAENWASIGTITNATTTYQEFTSDLSSYSNIYIRLLDQRSTGTHERYVDDFTVTAVASTPAINVSTPTLPGFTYVVDEGPSDEQNFTVSGSNLTANISISAPTNYEISTGTGATFVATSPITLTQASGSVAQTTIYVRLKDNLAIGTYNQDISIVSDGATSQTVSCSGEVTTPTAPVAPVATAASVVGSDSFTANWNSVSGATGYYLDVYVKEAGGNASDLFFSEYIEGSSNNKALEIFNGTGLSIDLSGYSIKTYSGTNTTANYTHDLTGTLLNGEVYVVANSSANKSILDKADVLATVTFYNGDDAVGLYNGYILIDVLGEIGSGTMYGENVTLVRKADASAPNNLYDANEWNSHPQDTFTYLGSHTFDGGTTLTYVTGFENKNVSNVTSYAVTGLDPETTYYYVVRAYDDYSQTSANSDEIEVTTAAAIVYDYPEDTEIDAGEVLIKITGGSGLIVTRELTRVPNPSFVTTFEQAIELTGDGPWIVTVYSLDDWVACLFDGEWSLGEVDGTGYSNFWLELPEGKSTVIELKSGNGGNPTLPVELSTFTVLMNGYNHAVLTWVTQTETGVSGFYVYRNNTEDLATAEMVSNLIPATNTSQQQVYLFTDKELGGPGTYYYWLQVSDMDGSDSFYGPITLVYQGGNEPGIPSIPQVTELKSIYPNPFNPSATISYGLAEAADVKVQIFNSRGQLVRSISEGQRNAGNYNLIWNGTDNNGQSQPTGVYFFRLKAGNKVFNSKAVLMK